MSKIVIIDAIQSASILLDSSFILTLYLDSISISLRLLYIFRIILRLTLLAIEAGVINYLNLKFPLKNKILDWNFLYNNRGAKCSMQKMTLHVHLLKKNLCSANILTGSIQTELVQPNQVIVISFRMICFISRSEKLQKYHSQYSLRRFRPCNVCHIIYLSLSDPIVYFAFDCNIVLLVGFLSVLCVLWQNETRCCIFVVFSFFHFLLIISQIFFNQIQLNDERSAFFFFCLERCSNIWSIDIDTIRISCWRAVVNFLIVFN